MLVILLPSTPEGGTHFNHMVENLAFATPDISGVISREVGDQLGGSDHRLIVLTVQSVNFNKGQDVT